MVDRQEQLNTLTEIRSLMQQSVRFISLSGLSGIFAGSVALVGAAIAYFRLNPVGSSGALKLDIEMGLAYEFVGIASCVLLVAVAGGVFFTAKRAKAKGLAAWDDTSKRLLINLMIPLVVGGLFCLILLRHHQIMLIAPATLLFYGLALVNASKYTLEDVRYLGYCQLLLGLVGAYFTGYGLVFWAIGFGVLHIAYGVVMHLKYK